MGNTPQRRRKLKKLILALLLSVLIAPLAHSAVVITDPDVFYSMFDYPDTTIDFLKLKDGTAFNNLPDHYKANTTYLNDPENLIVHTGKSNGNGGFHYIAVRPHAFSDEWSFERAHPTDLKNNRAAVVWFGQGITTGSFEMIVSSTTPQSKPFVIHTEKGFMGIVPSSPQETRFVFDDCHVIYSLETGFLRLDPAPQPPANNHYLQRPNSYQEI
jgi:hypothetical protein